MQKERLFQNRKPSFHSKIDESLKGKEANIMSKMKIISTRISTPRKNKQVLK
jgi:hypothetical protein